MRARWVLGLLLLLAPGISRSQVPTLWIYSDSQGSSCTFSDVAPGLATFYVVLNGPGPFLAVQFAAPKPACLAGTHLADDSQYLVIGNSQAGMSVAFGDCVPGPVLVTSMSYLLMGSSASCCMYTPGPDPVPNVFAAVDCGYNLIPLIAGSLTVNPNETCDPPGCGSPIGLLRVADAFHVLGGPTDTVRVNVDVTNGLSTLSGGSVDVTYDPTRYQFLSCERGGLTATWQQLDGVDLGSSVRISAFDTTSLDANESGTLATLVFKFLDCPGESETVPLCAENLTGDLTPLVPFCGSISCGYTADGDVNGDGDLTVADAQCAFEAYFSSPDAPGCAATGWALRGNVNCTGGLTPADALCIFRNWLDGSCTFCTPTGSSLVALARAQSTPGQAPHVTLLSVREGDEWVVSVRVSGRAEMNAFGFELDVPHGMELVSTDYPRGASYTQLRSTRMHDGVVRVGAYAEQGITTAGASDLLSLRFRDSGAGGVLVARGFVDDLNGAEDVTLLLGEVPPQRLTLHQNMPNPFNPGTTIRFAIPEDASGRVTLAVYRVDGARVATLIDGTRAPGEHVATWDGRDARGVPVATGVYFCVLEAAGQRLQRKMVLLK